MPARPSFIVLFLLLLVVPGLAHGQERKLVPSDGAAQDLFGLAVALDAEGTYALVGARSDGDGLDSGSAYVFARSDTSWSEQTELTASDADASHFFGETLALSADGTYALVGATGNDDAGFRSGSAYVFTRAGAAWTEQIKLTASDAASGDLFGRAVDLSGDGTYAVVAASGDDGPTAFISGSAYVFVRNGTTWTEQDKLLPLGVPAGDQFQFGSGASVSADGLYALVWGRRIDGNTGELFGRVHVYARSGTAWSQQAVLTPSDSVSGQEFGVASINADGTYVVAGANGDDVGGTSMGSAYVFTRTGTTWTEQAKLTASDGEDFDEFGGSVSIDAEGSRILIASNGAVYLFTRDGTTWSEQDKRTSSDGVRIGRPARMSASGDYAIAAARSDTVNGTNSGSAYILELGPLDVPLAVEWIDLSATLDDTDVHLAWRTASEANNAGFAVERRRASGPTWRDVAWIDGQGTTTDAHAYRYTVSDLPPGLHRFRLKQVDHDGTFAYSPEVEVDVPEYDAQQRLRLVGASPVRERAALELRLPVAQTLTVTVHDALGRRVAVLYEGWAGAEVPVALQWEAGDAASGLYLVRAEGERFRATRGLVLLR